jgi:hypothetical protein
LKNRPCEQVVADDKETCGQCIPPAAKGHQAAPATLSALAVQAAGLGASLDDEQAPFEVIGEVVVTVEAKPKKAGYDPAVDLHPEGYSCSTVTPWGPAQVAYKYAPGIINYSCAGHGGFHLSPTRNAQVHPAWSRPEGWYEEDCEYSIAVLSFPDAFHPDMVASAHESAKNWFPREYEAVTGGVVDAEESSVLRDEIFLAEHAHDYLTTAAWGDWADWVPKGKVGVTAKVGGRESAGEEKRFLVDAERYQARKGTYVVDLERDEAAA